MCPPNQGRNIERFDADHFQIRTSFGNEGDGDYILAHREQIRLFFHYDHALRRNNRKLPKTPMGYHQFREAYIREAKTRARFAYCREDENGTPRVVVSGPAPTKEEVLSGDADLRSREEQEGGTVLNKSQVETVNSLLWGLAERLQRQKERSQRGYQDRRERREARRRERGPLAGRSSKLVLPVKAVVKADAMNGA